MDTKNLTNNLQNSHETLNSTNRTSSVYENLEFWLILYPAIAGAILIVGIIGNTLVIYVISTEKALQTSANILFLNLAIADLLYVCIWIPSRYLDMLVAFKILWRANTDLSCKLVNYIQNTTLGVTPFCLVSICVFRCLAIRNPLQATRRLTKRNAILTCIGIWVTLLTVNIPCLFYFVLHPDSRRCAADVKTKGDVYIFHGVVLGFDFFLPTALFFLSSASTVTSMRRRILDTATTGSGDVALEAIIQQTRKVICLVVIVFSMYFICCAPANISVLLLQTGMLRGVPREVRSTMLQAFLLLMCFNSAINPIIYNFWSRDYRKAFRYVFRQWRKALRRRRRLNSSRSRSRSSRSRSGTNPGTVELQMDCLSPKSIKNNSEHQTFVW